MEIDFIATKQENKLYIQVTQEIGSTETEQREYGRLLDIRDNYPKYVLRTGVLCLYTFQTGINYCCVIPSTYFVTSP